MTIIKWFLNFTMLSVCICTTVPSPHPTYMTRYDYIDVDQVLSNDRILKRLMDCIMDRGPCTSEGKELKKVIPDALRTNCGKCNERQKMNAGRALAFLLFYKPQYWNELLTRFDQDGSIRKKLNIELEDDGINTKNETENKKSNRKTRSLMAAG